MDNHDSKNQYSDFAKNLLTILEQRGKTRLQLADFCDVSRQAVDSWINGTRMPRYNKINLICEFLGCDAEDLTNKPKNYVDYITKINPKIKETAILLANNDDLYELLSHAQKLKNSEIRALITIARKMHD